MHIKVTKISKLFSFSYYFISSRPSEKKKILIYYKTIFLNSQTAFFFSYDSHCQQGRRFIHTQHNIRSNNDDEKPYKKDTFGIKCPTIFVEIDFSCIISSFYISLISNHIGVQCPLIVLGGGGTLTPSYWYFFFYIFSLILN